jgi:small subunit ribosomal protein S20
MANIKSAAKRIKTIEKKTIINKSVKTGVKTSVKKFNEAVDSGDKATAQEAFDNAEKTMSKTASKGIMHKNTASRKTSRMAKRLNKMD